jgi:hypothetical protein
MNQDRNVDEVVARWVDEGPDAAPERFVWAALDEVERTPQRGSWRIALENLPMFAKLAVPIVGAAAVLVLGILAYQQFGGVGTGNVPSPSPQPTVTPSAAGGESPCRAEVVTVPTRGPLDVVWCIPRGLDQEVVAFAFDGPAEWADQVYTGGESLYLRPSGGGAIAFFLNGPDTIDAWLADITGTEAFEVSEPQPVTVDGVDGFVVDVRLAEGATEAPPLIENSDVPWNLTEGNAARVWIVDAEPEAMAIVTGAPEADFEAWADTVGAAIETLHWNPIEGGQ